MCRVIDPQLKLGERDIRAIQIDPRSRDDILRILRGLRCVCTTPEVRERIFAISVEALPMRPGQEGPVSAAKARPGLERPEILVPGTLRLGSNAD